VLFYFSGHCFFDKYNEVFLAPYDMVLDEPSFGINMRELAGTISDSKNKKNIIMVFDCCYNRIATKGDDTYISSPHTVKVTAEGDSSISLSSIEKQVYAVQLKELIGPSPSEQERGKFLLASGEPNAVSRERDNCKHHDDDVPHKHGAFSFHLIEGLNGKAADPETGFITIDNLFKHIEKQMNYEGRQKPMYYIALPSQIEDIKIAVSQTQFNKKISQLIGDVEQRLNQKIEGSSLVDIQTLTEAAKDLRELESLDPKNKERPILVKALDDALHMYKEPMEKWINRNMLLVRPKINQIQAGLYDNTLYSLIESLSYNELKNFDQVNLQYLIILCSEIINNKQ
jgi:hypothetical protein